eukprot:TRINITY_DN594_c3_g1_i2.p1 TRINITY_DN594_c3_g1~~TRINITY_DN594_c3_g1_i2.p1  ORF type:complete len:256 (+),score=37.71 TRINITY_DN594_c3_g1_i2:60-770(+)
MVNTTATSNVPKSLANKKQRLINRAPAQTCWMIDAGDNFKISTLKKMVEDCRVLARFSLLGKIYFTGNVKEDYLPELREAYSIIETVFGADIRTSKVLVLSMRDSRKIRKPLTLQNAVDIVTASALGEWIDDIELIGIQAQRSKKVHHIYVQMSSPELAESLVHVVDAFPFEDHFIHSPQVDDHYDFYGGRKGRSSTWINPSYKPIPDLLDSMSDCDDGTDTDSVTTLSCGSSCSY